MNEYEKFKALIEAEQYSKKNMGIEKRPKKKKGYGCLISIVIISFLLTLFYFFALYYRHHLFVELGL
jgi:hypothetical protein